jgi:hypothetical protein
MKTWFESFGFLFSPAADWTSVSFEAAPSVPLEASYLNYHTRGRKRERKTKGHKERHACMSADTGKKDV